LAWLQEPSVHLLVQGKFRVLNSGERAYVCTVMETNRQSLDTDGNQKCRICDMFWLTNSLILDFKLSPCSECCVLYFG
jgi:hypothetical protein